MPSTEGISSVGGDPGLLVRSAKAIVPTIDIAAFLDGTSAGSAEVARQVAQPTPGTVRGWSAFGAEGLSYSLGEAAPGDLKENIDMGSVGVDRADPYIGPEAAGDHIAPSSWPDEPADMQEAWEKYFEAMSELARQVVSIFATSRCSVRSTTRTSSPSPCQALVDRPVEMDSTK